MTRPITAATVALLLCAAAWAERVRAFRALMRRVCVLDSARVG